MIQIAIGDSTKYYILEGASVAAPYCHAAAHFADSPGSLVSEELVITLKGTPGQIEVALGEMEGVVSHAQLYAHKAYPSPQYLRFQLEPDGDYFFSEIRNLSLTSCPAGYLSRPKGSLVITLHFTRANYFDGPQAELPLSGRFGEDVLGGVPLYNHSDDHSLHGSTVYIKPEDLASPLPAPLRIELENTTASDAIKDVYIGRYYHPSYYGESPFFHNAPDIAGGTLLMASDAISGYFRRLSWSGTTWTALASITLTLDMVDVLGGLSYRPLVHFYASHSYSDLYLSFKLQRGSSVIYASEPAYADPSYDYLFLPPVDLPPNQLLRETPPHSMDIVLYAYKLAGSSYTLDIDQVQLFPLDCAAAFLGFFTMNQDDTLIDDSFRGLSNVRYTAAGSEMVAHIRQGSAMCLHSAYVNRLFFVLANQSNQVDILRTATLRVYQRERRRIL